MNILYVSDSTTVSGAEIVMLGYVEALRRRGHQPFAFVSKQNPRLISALGDMNVPLHTTDSYSRRMLETTANPSAWAVYAGAFYSVTQELALFTSSAGINLMHSISYPASLYAALGCARTGIRQIWHEHNIKHLHPVNKLVYRLVSRTCSYVVGPSDAVTDNLAKTGIRRGKLRTVYNGIDLERFRPKADAEVSRLRRDLGVEEGESAVGLFGQMLPYKGHATLIAAAPEILRAHPNTQFYFVGALENPPYQEELYRRIEGNGLQARIHFTGWRNDVQNLIRAMDVVVVATTTPEPAALMLMEAAAMERVVVASRTGGTPEILADGETGLLFDPDDPAQLADRVIQLLNNADLRGKFGVAGRTRVQERFSRDRHLHEMFALYDACDANMVREQQPVDLFPTK